VAIAMCFESGNGIARAEAASPKIRFFLFQFPYREVSSILENSRKLLACRHIFGDFSDRFSDRVK
jgi:hypothetical protein